MKNLLHNIAEFGYSLDNQAMDAYGKLVPTIMIVLVSTFMAYGLIRLTISTRKK